MNDTPRTEIYVLNPHPESVPADFARELERELRNQVASHAQTAEVAAAAIAKLDKVKYCLRMFDKCRESAQGTVPCKSRTHHADMLIEAVREALNSRHNAERIHGGAGQSKQSETPTPLDGASC